jgi:hypothetical protein
MLPHFKKAEKGDPWGVENDDGGGGREDVKKNTKTRENDKLTV